MVLQNIENGADINGQSKEWKKPISFTVQHEGQNLDVHGFVAIRIPGSVKDAGFTLIRRGRVIPRNQVLAICVQQKMHLL